MYNGQIFADAFVDQVLNIDNGYFVDIGAGTGGLRNRPIGFFSNTYYLESNRGWNGIAIDYDEVYMGFAKTLRSCCCVCEDLLKVNINDVLANNNCPPVVDYLSFDVDDAQEKVFAELDFDRYTFKIITYEHNLFQATTNVQPHTQEYKAEILNLHRLSREKFLSLGYELLLGNVVVAGYGPVEDWYIHPDHVKNTKGLNLDRWELENES